MNNDDNKANGGISEEMEVRIMSWALGEASDSEAEELARFCAANPEGAAYHDQARLAARAASRAAASDEAPIQMSAERRKALLGSISSPTSAASKRDADLFVLRQKWNRRYPWMVAVAACAIFGLFVSVLVPSYQKVRPFTATYGIEAKSATAVPGEVVLARVQGAGAEPELLGKKEVAMAAPEPARIEAPSTIRPPLRLNTVIPGGAPENEDRDEYVADQKPTVLEPFVVGATEDTGSYKAESTLAGTRVRTDLKDVASSISVATSQFLKDTGASNVGSIPGNPPGGATVATSTTTSSAEQSQEEPTVLSPFVVDSSQDKGSYRAEGTLAGTRVRTDLSDVASAINQDAVTDGDLATNQPAKGTSKAWGGVYRAVPTVEAPATSGAVTSSSAVTAGLVQPSAPGDGETTASREPFSTFSLNVSNASFLIARTALRAGNLPDAATIRPEEFYNSFDYGDPATPDGESISCRIEQAADPVLQQRNLVRIAMRVPRAGRAVNQALRLVVLLDTSGSMEREDRAAAVKNAVKLLVSKLHAGDQVTLVGFARKPRLLADRVPGDKAEKLLKIIASTPPEGGTNLEEAIKAAGEMARNQFVPGAQNRIILLTDGAANLGDANPADLGKLVENLRQGGVSFDACGIGDGGIEDSVLEALTRKGSGRYLVLDSTQESAGAFAGSIAGALRPAAENVKLQVRFNPARVGHYRLVGFEKQRLDREDFRNDSVASSSLAPGESAVALYEVEALPQGDGDLGQVYVRFRDPSSGAMIERSWEVPYDASARPFDIASPSMKLAGVSALLAENLRGGPRGAAIRLADYEPVVQELRRHYAHEAAVQDLAAMFEETRRLHRE